MLAGQAMLCCLGGLAAHVARVIENPPNHFPYEGVGSPNNPVDMCSEDWDFVLVRVFLR